MNKKLEKLCSRSKELAEEIKAKEETKAKIDSEIEKLRMQELKAFLITNNIGLDDGFYDMAMLVKQIIDSGIDSKEIRGMLGTEESPAEKEKTDDKVNKATEEKNSNEK